MSNVETSLELRKAASRVPVVHGAIEQTVTDDDALDEFAVRELRAEHPDIFPSFTPQQQVLIESRKLEMLNTRLRAASHDKMAKILSRVEREELWRFHPEGFSSFTEYAVSLGISQSFRSQLVSWINDVFPYLDNLGYEPDEVLQGNITNVRNVTPHLAQLATGKPSSSQRVQEEVEALLERFEGDKDEAARFLVDQALMQPTRALRQNIVVGEEDLITFYYERLSYTNWRIWCDEMTTAQRDLVLRRISDVAEIVEVVDE